MDRVEHASMEPRLRLPWTLQGSIHPARNGVEHCSHEPRSASLEPFSGRTDASSKGEEHASNDPRSASLQPYSQEDTMPPTPRSASVDIDEYSFAGESQDRDVETSGGQGRQRRSWLTPKRYAPRTLRNALCWKISCLGNASAWETPRDGLSTKRLAKRMARIPTGQVSDESPASTASCLEFPARG